MSEAKPTSDCGRAPRFPWQTLVLEFLSVLLGVLAAFAVDEWRQQRAERERARVALANITREISANRDHLQQVIVANEAREADESASEVAQDYAVGWGLRSTAWEVARSTGAIDALDYETVLSLSALYQFQRTYVDLIHALASAQMVAILGSEEDDLARIESGINSKMKVFIEVLSANEQQLLAWYERSLSSAAAGS